MYRTSSCQGIRASLSYLAFPSGVVVFTASMASTAILAKKSSSAPPMILDDIAVLAQLISASLPSVSTLMARFSSMNLHACECGALWHWLERQAAGHCFNKCMPPPTPQMHPIVSA